MDNVNRLRVGLFAPDFVLKDSKGNKIALGDFRGKKNLLLFFFRGKRDQVCLGWLEELNRLHDQIQMRETEVLALSQDESWISRRIREERKIQFPILKIEGGLRFDSSDSSVTQLYGVQTRESEEVSLYPAFFLVDKAGTIRYRRVYTHPSEQFNPEDLLCELDKLG
jgi:peroxiredoxin